MFGAVSTALFAFSVAWTPPTSAQACGFLGQGFLNKNRDYTRMGRSGRIMGGQNVPILDVPWVVRIDANGEHTCTGTLISHRHVLTAAHCFSNETLANQCEPTTGKEYTICAGMSSNKEACLNKFDIKFIYYLRHYLQVDKCRSRSDFVVVELKIPIDIHPVCLPVALNGIPSRYNYNRNAYYFGYSKNVDGEDERYANAFLRYVNAGVPLDKRDEFLRTNYTNTRAICDGDSGGPMIEIHGNRAVLIGVNVNADGNCTFYSVKPDEKYPKNRSLKVIPKLGLLKRLYIPY